MKRILIIALMMVSCVSISKAQILVTPVEVSGSTIYFSPDGLGLFVIGVPDNEVPFAGQLRLGEPYLPQVIRLVQQSASTDIKYNGVIGVLGGGETYIQLMKARKFVARLAVEFRAVKEAAKVSKAQKKADAKKAAENYAKRRAAAGTDTSSRVRTVKVDSNGVHAVNGSEYDFSF